MDTISKQFIFKQKIRKNIQMPSSNVIVQISKFFSKTKETMSTSEHLDILSIFPERRKRFVETVQKFSPEICIMPPIIKEILPNNSNSMNKTHSIINKKTVSCNSSETESNGSNYNVNKSIQKRKKKSGKARNFKGTKKQKSVSMDSIVKDEPVTESCEEQPKKFEFFLCDQNDTVFRKSRTVLNTSRLNLTKEQEGWINETMESTERNENFYSCKFCFKDLKSSTAMCYHYINRHLLKKLTKKQVWVAHKIKEGIIQVECENGLKMTKWKCTECSKIYNNQPGIRYHLTKHLKDDFNDIFEISDVK
ncbi:hypothetical protein ACKWTF_012203 [Chironomus riparius]